MGKIRREPPTNRLRTLIAALAAAALGALVISGPASAKQIQPYKFQKFFDGTGSTAGPMTPSLYRVTINHSNGRVYVLDAHSGSVDVTQFNANGEPQLWSGLGGVSSFETGSGLFNPDLEFDNTGNDGGLYVRNGFGTTAIQARREDGTIRLAGFGPGGGGCGIGVDPAGFVWSGSGQWASKMNPDTGFLAVDKTFFFEQQPCHFAVDTDGYFWVNKEFGGFDYGPGLYKYGRESEFVEEGFSESPELLQPTYVQTQYAAVDHSNNHVYALEEGNRVTQYTDEGVPITTFGLGEGTYNGLESARGLAVNPTTHDVYVTDLRSGAQPVGKESPVSPRIDVFQQQPAITVPDATTIPAGHPSKTTAILKGIVNADGLATTQCKFEWGATSQYTGGAIPCNQGNVFTGSSDNEVTNELKSLTLGNTYHFRVAAKNANEQWSYGVDRSLEASIAPDATPVIVDRVNTDGARFSATINPNGGTTKYHFEVGLADCASNPCVNVPTEDPTLESNLITEEISATAIGLLPDTGYFVRLVAENGAGQDVVPYIFRTYPSPPTDDLCGNAHVRQQTSASLLSDCRAYELVSAANAGGYDVESDLVPGQTPLSGYPDARDRVLYGLHFGSVPDIAGSPPNYGLDPYIADRGPTGWTTRYAGIPADGMADDTPFGSPLLGADDGLDSLAFGGAGICEPCFTGLGTNIPLRLNGGGTVPGMAGSLNPGTAAPAGEVRKFLSGDGTHLVFGSIKKYEAAGIEGALTIYERNLATGTTRVVSTDGAGATISGPGTAALDVSNEGSRVVIGKTVSTDAAGNDHHHLYMHIGDSATSADLTPGGGSSALYDGMSSDGSRAFFTTTDKLLAADTDTSADIYRADVTGAGAVTLELVSVKSNGAPSNSDACTPPGFPESWNAASGDGKCNALAFAAGGGVAADDGTFYFVSPELLDGASGVADQANLYMVEPGGDPTFVVTMDSSLGKPGQGPPSHPLVTTNFTGQSHSQPEALAVDQSNGDVLVSETSAGKVSRFTSAGAPKNFTAVAPYIEGNKLTGLTLGGNSASQVAVDNAASSPFNGSLYVTNGPTLGVFAPTGEKVGDITGSENLVGEFGKPCGVAVDQSNGTLYIGDLNFEVIWQYTPKAGATAPVTDSDYTVKAMLITGGFAPCNVAADSLGHVYASRFSIGPVRVFEAASFEAPYAVGEGTQFNEASRAVTVDPSTDDVYVDEGNQVKVFNSSQELQSTLGAGSIGGSRGVAVNGSSGHVYASSGVNVVEFGFALAPFHPIDNPGIVDAVQQAGTRNMADFQVTPDGRFAAFVSSLSLTGFANLGNSEIYRYDSVGQELECASCATTGAAAKTDTFLTPHGLNISEDGRVFFTSEEGLVLSDTNERKDAYQWSGGSSIGRISTGRSLEDSSLLTASRDGKDAFFFTREVLVPEDENGGAVKVYDAREGGGYLQSTTRLPCAASDECHGPGTQAPPPAPINSVTGTEAPDAPIGKAKKKACKKGKVRRGGKCVKRKSKRNLSRANG